MRYIDSLNNELKEYFRILCNNDYPEFIDKYIETEELKRISGIGYFCGIEYNNIPLLNVKYSSSRLDHSIACACIVWKLTHDKLQTIIALFHDVGTPAFSHSVDFMLKDFDKQESSEKSIREIIRNSTKINQLLKEDEIKIEQFYEINKYTIVENEKPKLCADRLEGVFHTGLIWRQFWSIEDILEIYKHIVICVNENNEQEISFNNLSSAENFFKGSYKYGISMQSSEDKLSMNLMGDILILANLLKIIEIEDLYILSEKEIINRIEQSNNSIILKYWNTFKNLKEVIRSEEEIPQKYCISVNCKKRYVNPLIKIDNRAKRISEVSKKSNDLLKKYMDYKDSKYIAVELNSFNKTLEILNTL